MDYSLLFLFPKNHEAMIPRRVFTGPAKVRALSGHALSRQWQGHLLTPLSSAKCHDPFAKPLTSRKWESTTAGDQKSGHIYTGPNESILFLDNIFPLKLTYGWVSYLLGRPWQTDEDLENLLKRFDKSSLGIADPLNLVKRTIPSDGSMKVTELIPRLKDGGCFVKVSHPGGTAHTDIEKKLSQVLREKPVKPWFNPFRSIKVGLVNGVPWLEDMARYPKNRLKVEFIPKEPGSEAVELSQEDLFALFRKYGKIADISSQPSDSKILPKYAYLDFAFTRDAIMARNCLHGLVVPESSGGGKAGTVLRLSYEQKVRPHHIWDWISSHPRIVIPLIAALLATITVIVFDPIREFFIKAHIQKSFSLSDNRVFQWFKRQTNDILAFRRSKDDAGQKALFTHRRDAIDQIHTWLLESTDTFIVVQGPRGSGKEELVLDQALGGRKDILVIDCKPVVEAKGESTTIKKLAGEVGYRPIFSWANQLSSLIDLAIQSTTGVKSGFSETLDSQLSKILSNTATALKKVSLSDRKKDDPDANLSDDAFLEAHPERRAVVVIENFLLKNEETSIVYDKLSEWAAALVQANIAHVIFLTNDSSYSKPLSKSLPDRVFRTIALGDLSPEIAKQYVLGHLTQTKPKHKMATKEEKEEAQQPETPKDMWELNEVIDVLGGRLTDLEFLARRMKTGQSPRQAVQEIIDQSASEIIKLFLLPNRGSSSNSTIVSSSNDRKFSPEQAWFLIKEIAKKESLRYNEVLLSNTFASSTTSDASDGELALESLANAELITVHSHRGRPQTIQAGRPVYQAAFDALLKDPVLKAKMDLAILTELSKIETKTIDKVYSLILFFRPPPKSILTLYTIVSSCLHSRKDH